MSTANASATPGSRSGIPLRGTAAGSGSSSPSISSPSPASRLRPRMSAPLPTGTQSTAAFPSQSVASPIVPPRSAAREAASPVTSPVTPVTPSKPSSSLPRTRKMSIPRLSAPSSSSPSASSHAPAVPPLPGTLGTSTAPRRSRLSGNLEPKTPKAQVSRAGGAPAQAPGPAASPAVSTPSVPRRQASLPAGVSSSNEVETLTRASPERTRSPPVRDGDVRERVDENGQNGQNGHHSHDEVRGKARHDGKHPHQIQSPEPSHALAKDPALDGIVHGRDRDVDLKRARDQLRDLEIQYRLLQTEHSRCNPRLERPMRALRQEGGSEGMEDKLVALLLDRDTLSTVVRSLPKDQRMGLLGVIAEACKPSDIQAQIEMLEKYKELRTGVLARLDDTLCTRVLHFLGRQDLLRLRLVSKRFDRLATSPRVWKALCRELEARWDGTIDLTNYHLDDDGDWLGLFKSLWQREKHWTNGEAQSLALLSGHKNYVTSLKLCGETLISASYDDTIRIWHLPYVISNANSVPPPTVVPARSVSSLDYYAPEGVLVTGSHDIGRASVWRQIDGEWKVERILSGHLHGTRAVAINAQWLVSVGSDKAIVVWDWRTGTKIVRFGQQTNVCVGMNLLDNFIITATVDGVIRTFSIAKREMLGQFKLSDMAARHPDVADKLKDVGVGALGMLTWFAAEGRFLACATKDIVIRLAWDWATPEEQAELEEGIESPTKAAFFEPPVQTPGTRTRASLGGAHPHSPASPRPTSPRSPRTSGSGSATASRMPPSMASAFSKAATPATTTRAADSEDAPPTTTNTTSRFALGRWPTVVEVLDITGTERGAFEAGRVRIVTSRRLSARAGAERRVLVGTEHASPDGSKMNMKLVPLGGMWDTLGRQAGLQGSSKNPMSLTLDHDKLVYGCSDGSIVVAGFVATQSRLRSRQASRSPTKPQAPQV